MQQSRRFWTIRSWGLTAALVLAGSLAVVPGAARADDTTASSTPAATSSSPADEPAEQDTTPPAGPSAEPTPTPTDTGGDAAPEPGDTVVGSLVQVYDEPGPATGTDSATAATDEPLSWIQTDSGATVRVLTEDVQGIPVGATVAVTVGDEVADDETGAGFEPAVEVLDADVLAAAPADRQTTAQTIAPVNHQVTVVMMQPAGAARDATTLAQVVAAVNAPVGDFWEQQTGGVVRVGVTAQYDWFQGTTSCSDPFALWAEAAAHAGNWTYAPGRHLVVYVPAGAAGCSYGLGEVRQNTSSGGQLYVQAAGTSVIAHELGHNFGLNHSSELQCAGTVEATASAACQISSYRDYYDVMGISWSQVGTLSALQAAQLGVLPAAQRADVNAATAAADYTLSPLGGSTGIRAVRLTAATGAVYWLEYRSALGQDQWLGTAANEVGLQSGVIVRRENRGAGDSSLLLDPTPSATGRWAGDLQVALPVGSPVTVGSHTLTVTAVTAGTATISVRPSRTPRSPVGSLDLVSVAGSTLTVGGWALDPDAIATSIPVHVYVDGVGAAITADGPRADVAAAFSGAGPAHGFQYSVRLAPGTHQVCVFAIDVADGPGHTGMGCRTVVRTAAAPIGSLDLVQVVGGRLDLGGWALDPDAVGTSSPVHVYLDGVGTAVTADRARTDIAAAVPGAGAAHGWALSLPLSPGTHSLCVFGIDISDGPANTVLGCRTLVRTTVAPIGSLDMVGLAGARATVAGWAVDPDAPAVSIPVHVYVDGVGTAVTADRARPDVAAVVLGAGSAHGWEVTVPMLPGLHSVCAFGIDIADGPGNSVLGCRNVTRLESAPLGSLDQAEVRGGTLFLGGWALDVDAPSSAVPVEVTLDGARTTVTADRMRADVGAAFSGAGPAHGWETTLALTTGAHRVCVHALDVSGGPADTVLGCRDVRA